MGHHFGGEPYVAILRTNSHGFAARPYRAALQIEYSRAGLGRQTDINQIQGRLLAVPREQEVLRSQGGKPPLCCGRTLGHLWPTCTGSLLELNSNLIAIWRMQFGIMTAGVVLPPMA